MEISCPDEGPDSRISTGKPGHAVMPSGALKVGPDAQEALADCLT